MSAKYNVVPSVATVLSIYSVSLPQVQDEASLCGVPGGEGGGAGPPQEGGAGAQEGALQYRNCTLLHCTLLYNTVNYEVYCTQLHCSALHCNALHCNDL